VPRKPKLTNEQFLALVNSVLEALNKLDTDRTWSISSESGAQIRFGANGSLLTNIWYRAQSHQLVIGEASKFTVSANKPIDEIARTIHVKYVIPAVERSKQYWAKRQEEKELEDAKHKLAAELAALIGDVVTEHRPYHFSHFLGEGYQGIYVSGKVNSLDSIELNIVQLKSKEQAIALLEFLKELNSADRSATKQQQLQRQLRDGNMNEGIDKAVEAASASDRFKQKIATIPVEQLRSVQFAVESLPEMPHQILGSDLIEQKAIDANLIRWLIQRELDTRKAGELPYSYGEMYLAMGIPKEFLR
jgi:hypothetical protein